MIADLRGKVAVVTGAASGIGAAMVRRFAAEGMAVIGADIDLDGARRTLDGLADTLALPVDVADPDAVQALADEVFARHGRVDLLCNNAGVFQGGLSWERSHGDWDWTFGVNLYGIIHGITSFVPRMIAQDTEEVIPEIVRTDKNGYKRASCKSPLEAVKESEKRAPSALLW